MRTKLAALVSAVALLALLARSKAARESGPCESNG
jgi:hypothetical protein